MGDTDLNIEVQLELEKLNTASAEINEHENKLQELRNIYYETLSKCTLHLTEISNKIGSAVTRARPYYDLKRQQIEIQKESKIAATRYETACIQMNHATAVVSKTETSTSELSKLDDSTMEILNIAISKINLSKLKKNEAHKEHQYYLNLYMENEIKIHDIEKKYKNDIKKSKGYFNYSKHMDDKLKDCKLNIEVYEDKVKACKAIYNDALQRLEDISNNIHYNREKNHLGPRGEGVGAELSKMEFTKHDSYSINLKFSDNKPSKPSSVSLLPRLVNNSRRRATISTTPIVDSLLRVVSSNYSQYKEPLHLSLPIEILSDNLNPRLTMGNCGVSSCDFDILTDSWN